MNTKIKLSQDLKDESVSFYADYLESVRALRSGLIEAFRMLNIDSNKPRETARQLGLDKSLAWKITRIIHEEEAPRIAGNIPGNSGMKQVTSSLVERELPIHIAESISDAYLSYQKMTKRHSSDKNSLELMLEGMNLEDEETIQKSRQYAYRGNCGIWGIQSSVRLSSHVIAINKDDPTQLDYAQLGGLLGFQRLRPGQPWPIFQFHSYEDTGKSLRSNMLPISENPNPEFPLIINEFCEGTLPDLHLTCDSTSTNYEFGDGIVGKTGSSDVFFGYVDTLTKPRYQDESNQIGELLCLIDSPIETLVFDLIVDRELAEQIQPVTTIYGRATGPKYGLELRMSRNRVPFAEPLRFLEPGAHMLTTPLVPSYVQLGDQVMDRMGRVMSDFVCWRLVMKYPVMPSTVSIKFSLETKD